jgi:hypothetical protein
MVKTGAELHDAFVVVGEVGDLLRLDIGAFDQERFDFAQVAFDRLVFRIFHGLSHRKADVGVKRCHGFVAFPHEEQEEIVLISPYLPIELGHLLGEFRVVDPHGASGDLLGVEIVHYLFLRLSVLRGLSVLWRQQVSAVRLIEVVIDPLRLGHCDLWNADGSPHCIGFENAKNGGFLETIF